MNPPNAAPPSAAPTAARQADGDAVGIAEMSSAGQRALVIGGGIGGLSAALCLASVGADVLVFEAAAEIAELGVGLNVQPAAVGVLAELGLLPALDTVGIRTAELLLMTRRGQLVLRQPRGLAAGAEHPQLSVHRGHLQRVLLAAPLRPGSRGDPRPPPSPRPRGRRRPRDCGVRRRRRERAVEGDLIVGADGIHSTARAVLVRDAGPPHWNGSLMWRGATEWPTFLSGSSMIVAGGNAAKAVIYPVAPGRTGSSRLTNWAIVLRTAPAGTPPPRPVSWTSETIATS